MLYSIVNQLAIVALLPALLVIARNDLLKPKEHVRITKKIYSKRLLQVIKQRINNIITNIIV